MSETEITDLRRSTDELTVTIKDLSKNIEALAKAADSIQKVLWRIRTHGISMK